MMDNVLIPTSLNQAWAGVQWWSNNPTLTSRKKGFRDPELSSNLSLKMDHGPSFSPPTPFLSFFIPDTWWWFKNPDSSLSCLIILNSSLHEIRHKNIQVPYVRKMNNRDEFHLSNVSRTGRKKRCLQSSKTTRTQSNADMHINSMTGILVTRITVNLSKNYKRRVQEKPLLWYRPATKYSSRKSALSVPLLRRSPPINKRPHCDVTRSHVKL